MTALYSQTTLLPENASPLKKRNYDESKRKGRQVAVFSKFKLTILIVNIAAAMFMFLVFRYIFNDSFFTNSSGNESWLAHADKMGTISGNKADKSEAFAWTMGENGAPLIDEAKVSIECEVDGNYELENFDHFICKILATYADETVLNEQGKIDYHTFKPVLFEFPTYEYFVTGEKAGNCGKMN